MVVVTNSGSSYVVDSKERKISGGKITDMFGCEVVEYAEISPAIVGLPFVAKLCDGRVFRTSCLSSVHA